MSKAPKDFQHFGTGNSSVPASFNGGWFCDGVDRMLGEIPASTANADGVAAGVQRFFLLRVIFLLFSKFQCVLH